MMFRQTRTATVAIAAVIALGATAGCSSAGTAEPAETLDPGAEVTLDFSFWGNDARAVLYEEAIALFNEEHPNITVRSSFLAWAEYWEKRQTEAAGGGLPDVMQTDINYLRQYDQNGLLLDLDPYLGSIIDGEAFDDSVLANGELDDKLLGITISTNALGMFVNPGLAEEVGVEAFEGGTWDDYEAWLEEARASAVAKGLDVWGGSNFAASLQNFEIRQRSKGENLFTDAGDVNFTKDDLREYWALSEPLFEDDLVTPTQRTAEFAPLTAFDGAVQLSEITWDTMGAGYLANLGEAYPALEVQAPPVTEPGAKDLYKKAGMLLSASSNTDQPAAAATLIDFLANDPGVAEIFGTSRGIPASETALEGAVIEGIDAQVLEYEQSIADRLGDAPPLPVVGYGSIDLEFRTLSEEIGYGTITVDAAVDRLFTELDVILAG